MCTYIVYVMFSNSNHLLYPSPHIQSSIIWFTDHLMDGKWAACIILSRYYFNSFVYSPCPHINWYLLSISHQPHGRAWKIHDKEQLVRQVIPNFFGQSKYESFTRQLNGKLTLYKRNIWFDTSTLWYTHDMHRALFVAHNIYSSSAIFNHDHRMGIQTTLPIW